MNKIFKRKKLNNKGFTLIELLAVIVILAVVMGVAANAILNVMNDSRKNTLQSSAKSAADAFRSAYAENQLKNNEKILTYSKDETTALLSGTAQPLTNVSESLNLSKNNYDLAKSYVYYNSGSGSFAVCLVAKTNGSYYLATAIGKSHSGTGEDLGPVHMALDAKDMWACSNDEHSWPD